MNKKREDNWQDYWEKSKYRLIIIALMIFIMLAVKLIITSNENKANTECVLQKTGCCGCEMGGNSECMTEGQALIIQKKLAEECRKEVMCAAVYLCENITCRMIDGKCQKSKS